MLAYTYIRSGVVKCPKILGQMLITNFISVTYFFQVTNTPPGYPTCVSTTFVEEMEPTPLFLFFSDSRNISIALMILIPLLEECIFGFSEM